MRGTDNQRLEARRRTDPRLRFHDLRPQTITDMAEAGASDTTLMADAGHPSRRLLEHYSHVRMAAKRSALEKLESGLGLAPRQRLSPRPFFV